MVVCRPGFMVKNCIASRLHSILISYSDHLMSLHLPVQNKKLATIISVYIPTPQADLGEKEAFYCNLQSLL